MSSGWGPKTSRSEAIGFVIVTRLRSYQRSSAAGSARDTDVVGMLGTPPDQRVGCAHKSADGSISVTMRQSIVLFALTLWFGVPLPTGLGDPHRPILDVATVKPAPAMIPPGEEGHAELAGGAVRKHLEAIVGISRADRARGEKAWGRITGFRAADETHAWVLQQFKAAGLRDPQTQTYASTQPTWYPKSWEVKLLATPEAG